MPTLCRGAALGLGFIWNFSLNLEATLCAGVALGLDLTSKVHPEPGSYTACWCQIES